MKDRILLNFRSSAIGFEPELWELTEDMNFISRKVDEDTLILLDPAEKKNAETILHAFNQCSLPNLIRRLKNPKIKTISEALKNKELETKIKKWHDENLHHLIEKYLRWSNKISLGVERKDYVGPKLVTYDPEIDVRVKFFIKKESNGLSYRLELLLNNQELQIRASKIDLISRFPAWLVIKNQLLHIPNIKSGFIMPFSNKDVVHIQEEHIHEFFAKIVKPYIGKAEFALDGFPFEKVDTITGVSIKFQRHLFHNSYGYSLHWNYGEWMVAEGSPFDQFTKLEINEAGDPVVLQYQRNKSAEKNTLDILGVCIPSHSMGLFNELHTKFDHIESITDYLRSKWDELKVLSIPNLTIELIDEDGNFINIMPYILEKSISRKIDWLDLDISLIIGEQRIHFSHILECIRNRKGLYRLKDKTHFLIPALWTSQYDGIIKYGTWSDNSIQIELKRIGIVNTLYNESEEFINPSTTFLTSDLGDISLRTYQIDGVSWLLYQYQNGYGGLLADDMGLGKTVQILAFLKLLHAKSPKNKQNSSQIPIQLSLFDPLPETDTSTTDMPKVLIVAPSTVCLNWIAETKKFIPEINVYKHIGPSRSSSSAFIADQNIVLTSYHLLRQDADIILPIAFDILILDEAQIARNPESDLYQVLLNLKVRSCFALSGTPIENSPLDLWAIIQLIDSQLLPSRSMFMDQCRVGHEIRISDTDKALLKPHMLRRTKSMVLNDLPDIDIVTRYVEMGDQQHDLYQKQLSKVRNEVNSELDPKRRSILIFTHLMKLRQIANHPLLINQDIPSTKMEATCEILQELLNKKEKCLIFSSFEQHLLLYKKYVEDQGIVFQLLSGSTSQQKRLSLIENFEKSDNPFLFITLKAGGTGINLVAASYVLILDPWWNPASEMQAISRAYRIGQTKRVTAIKIISSDTIEEKIQQLQETKQALAEDFFDAVPKTQLTQDQIKALLV